MKVTEPIQERIRISILPTDNDSLVELDRFPNITVRFTARNRAKWVRSPIYPINGGLRVFEDNHEIDLSQVKIDPRPLPLDLLVITDNLDPGLTHPELAKYLVNGDNSDLEKSLTGLQKLAIRPEDNWLVCSTTHLYESKEVCIARKLLQRIDLDWYEPSPLDGIKTFVDQSALKEIMLPLCPESLLGDFLSRQPWSAQDRLILLITKAPNPNRCGSLNAYFSVDTANTIRQNGIKLVWIDLTFLSEDAPAQLRNSASRMQVALTDRVRRAGGIFLSADKELPDPNSVSNWLEEQTTPVYELTYQSQAFNDGEPHQIEIEYQSDSGYGTESADLNLGQSQFTLAKVQLAWVFIFLLLAVVMLGLLIISPLTLKASE